MLALSGLTEPIVFALQSLAREGKTSYTIKSNQSHATSSSSLLQE